MARAEDNDLPVRGHILIWPGVDNAKNRLPDFGEYDLTTPVSALEAALANTSSSQDNIDTVKQELRDKIKYVFSDWAGKWNVYEWDVGNEPRSNHRITQGLLGIEEMAEWFHIAEYSAPHRDKCKLVLNEFGVISASPSSVDVTQCITHRNATKYNLNAMIDNGCRLYRIGFQSRMKRGHLDPQVLHSRLEDFATAYELEMVGTEFEVKENDSSSNLLLDEYLRSQITEETLTICFSHALVTGLNAWSYMGDGVSPMCTYDGTIKLNALVWYYLHMIRGRWR